MSDRRGQGVDPNAPLPPVVSGPVGPETPPTQAIGPESAAIASILFAGAVKEIIRNCRDSLDRYQGVDEGPARRSVRAFAYLQISDRFEETFGPIREGGEFR